MKIEEMIKRVFVETGRANENWRVIVNNTRLLSVGSDFAVLDISVFRPRCRKASYKWNVIVDIARGLVRWDKSEFVRC